MDKIDFYAEHAKEKAGLPSGWRAYRYRSLPENSRECLYVGVKGGVVPDKTRGENQGEPNWRSKEISHEQEVYFTPAEHDAWLLQWEAKTCKCHVCQGSGQEWTGWGVDTGHRHKTCTRCAGTGQAPGNEASAKAA
jgi:DnaJ-class molecular chaperone